VRLSLVNNVSSGLIAMARDFGKANEGVDTLMGKLKKMSTSTKSMFGGAVAMGAGAALAMAFKPAIDEARKFQTAQANFRLFGMSDAQNNEAFAFAKHMDVAGSSYVENLKKMTEAQGAFRESGLIGSAALAGVKLAGPMLARLATVAKAQGHEMSESDDKALVRAIEMSGGLINAATFNSRADAIFKLVGSSGNMVKYEDVRAFYARGGVSAKNLTEDALMKLEPVIGELKGTTAGTALMTAFNRLNGAVKLPNQIIHDLVRSGVWNARAIEFNSQGGVKNIHGNPLDSAEEMASDPVAWYRKNIMPMYARMAISTPAQQNIEDAKLFGRTGAAFFSLIRYQAAAIDRSPGAIEKRQDIDQSAETMNQTFNGQLNIASAAWRNVLNNIGTAILPTVTAGLTTLTSILSKMADWTRDNPGLVKLFAYTGLAVSGVLVLGGALAVFAGTIALINWPVTLTVAAFLGLIALGQYLHNLNWSAIWDGIKEGFSSFINWIGNAWKHRPTWMGGDGVVNGAPTVGVNQTTQADRDYYASLSGSPNVRTASDRPFKIESSLFLTADGKRQLATNAAEHIATGIVGAPGGGSFDNRMAQAQPSQGY